MVISVSTAPKSVSLKASPSAQQAEGVGAPS